MKAPVTRRRRASRRAGACGAAASAAQAAPTAIRPRQPRSHRAHRRFCRRPRLSPDARHRGGLRARRRRHQLEPRAGARRRQERRVPGRRLRHHARGPAYLAAALAFTSNGCRPTAVAFAGDHLTADFNAQSFGGRVEGGYRSHPTLGGITPYAALQAQSFRTPSYHETDLTGGGFALDLRCPHRHRHAQRAGRALRHAVTLDPTALLTLRARLAWAHDWVTDPSLVAGVPDAAGHELHRQRRRAGEGLRARLGRRGAAFRQRDRADSASSTANSPRAPPAYAGTGTVRYAW